MLLAEILSVSSPSHRSTVEIGLESKLKVNSSCRTSWELFQSRASEGLPGSSGGLKEGMGRGSQSRAWEGEGERPRGKEVVGRVAALGVRNVEALKTGEPSRLQEAEVRE